MTTTNNILKLWGHISKRRHIQFYILLALMVLASLTEIISIGAVIPFLGVITTPEQMYQNSTIQPAIEILEIGGPKQLLFPITIAFIFAALLAGSVRLLLLYVSTKLSYSTGADLSIEIYRRTLYQEYSIHVGRNSSEVINGVITKTSGVIGGVIAPTLTLISSVFIMVAIVSALFVIDVTIAFSAIAGFASIYWGVILLTKKKLLENSDCIAKQSTQMIKALQEGLGGIRDILIDGTQHFYCQLYRDADIPLRHASAKNTFINGSPRYVIESIGMVLIALLAYSVSLREGGLTATIPFLGALALGAQRLLPALQQAYSAYSTIKGTSASFKDVLDLLDQPLPNYVYQPFQESIKFENEIELRNASFHYEKESPWILKNINLKIKKGACVGIVGATGSGKSTLIDIIMGLLPLTQGELKLDNQLIGNENKRAWQRHIAHVPQNIFLSDSPIEENIAFGIPKEKINHKRVEESAQKAQLSEVIEGWKDGYKTLVGERGVRISGGQRQRIGIARALYKKADVLIFDEATSALDSKTEQDVMRSIEALGGGLTILIIAHRVTTLKGCNQIIKLDENKMINVLSYEEIINEIDNR